MQHQDIWRLLGLLLLALVVGLVTGLTGWYGFYPPPGEYRAQVEADGYESVLTPPVTIVTQPFVLTVGLHPIAKRPLLMPWLGRGALR